MLAFSKEWLERVADKLKHDEVYQQKAKGFDSSFQFVIKADPARGVPAEHNVGLTLPDCDEVWEGLRADADYVMTGSYKVLHGIVTGKQGAVMAITTRKVKVKGNLAKLLKFTGATNRFVELLGEIDCEFEGDFA